MEGTSGNRGYLQDLNAPQLRAVKHVDGPILVLAGAGSGKTRVLTRRVAHLVLDQRVRPDQILAVTFTNKATNEMRERLYHLLGQNADQLWIATFHSAGLRILRRHASLLSYSSNFVVYDDDDSKAVMRALLKEMDIDEQRYPPASFLKAIDYAKNAFVLPEEFSANAHGYQQQLQGEVYARYQRKVFEANAMDFGDLLVNAVLLWQKFPDVLQLYQRSVRYVLVDEFQDTNQVQYLFVKLLTAQHRNLLVVGDDDQSIYAFRGATPRNILNFSIDFPGATVVKLEQNYRSTGNILEAGHAVICKNEHRSDKKLWTEGPAGSPITIFCGESENVEAQFIANEIVALLQQADCHFKDIAIFYRTNAQSRAIEEALMDRDLPYRIYGGLKFYDRKEIKDIVAYLRLIVNDWDDQAFLRIVNTPPRGIGPQCLKLVTSAAAAAKCSLFEAAAKAAGDNKHLERFVRLINELRSAAREIYLSELVERVIKQSDYEARLTAAGDVSAQSRIENLRELKALAMQLDGVDADHFTNLQYFLDRIALTSSDEIPREEQQDLQHVPRDPRARPNAISLMTLHLAKGLEFPVVFLTGAEEGLLPHYRSIEERTIDEERRLCYVGITRAMHTLYITRARRRGMFSAGGSFGLSTRIREASRFVSDIPPHCLNSVGSDFFANEWLDAVRFDEQDADVAYEEAYAQEEPARFFKRPKREKTRTSPDFALATADQLLAQNEHELDLAKLHPGAQVFHPHFGRGIVRSVEGDALNNPSKLKVAVKFDDSEEEKKLLAVRARLSLLE